MPYTNTAEVGKRITDQLVIDLVDDDAAGSIGATEQARFDECEESASQEIDAYLQVRYAVPISPTPPLVSVIAADLTIYYLYFRRAHKFGMPEEIMSAYKMRIKQLEMIAKGTLKLGEEPEAGESETTLVAADGPDPLFTGGIDGTLKDF